MLLHLLPSVPPQTMGILKNLSCLRAGSTKSSVSVSRRRPHSSRSVSAVAGEDDRKQKLLVILGATGSGKTRLSIELAAAFSGENINSDKIQLYKGLDITTNKIPFDRRQGVRHHLLGDLDPVSGELSPAGYRTAASAAIADISSRHKLPILVGGSNTYIHALLASGPQPDLDVFDGTSPVSTDLRYDCRFIWVRSDPSVLDMHLDRRVDDMVRDGMVDELAEFFEVEGVDSGSRMPLRKAIGVPEFAGHFRRCGGQESLEEAVKAVKENTRLLAERQTEKIRRLGAAGWDLRPVNPTPVHQAMMEPNPKTAMADAIWRELVLAPSLQVVKHFLHE